MPNNITELENKIFAANSIAIIGHVAPDTDSFSSAMALREIIKKYYTPRVNGRRQRKRIDIFLDAEEIPENLQIFFKSGQEEAKYFNPTNPLKKYGMAISVDCATKERMGKNTEIFDNAEQTANIDHHATNPKFADINFVGKLSSTCEALYYIFLHKRQYDVTKYIYSLLYSGIITDTNNLKNNADAKTTEKAVARIKQNLGTKLTKQLRSNFFENNSPAKDILNSHAYSTKNRKYYNDGKLCVITLNHRTFQTTGAEIQDAEGIVDEGLYRRGVLLSALFLEPQKGEVYVKLRGKEGIDVSELAQEYDGGGHEGQAAFQHKGNFNALVKQFTNKASQYVASKQEEKLEDSSEMFK